jgi:hypothetical protein
MRRAVEHAMFHSGAPRIGARERADRRVVALLELAHEIAIAASARPTSTGRPGA